MRASILIGVFLAILLSVEAHASGYGWYVGSFDWQDYQRENPLIDEKALALAREEADKYSMEIYKTRVLFHILNTSAGAVSPVPMVDESPVSNEFYWSDALRYAAEYQRKAGVKSFFPLFASGRPLWKSRGWNKCNDYSCSDAYVLLTPEEVTAFHAEVAGLNVKVRHPDDYSVYLLHLEGVLRKASAEERALFFEGHD